MRLLEADLRAASITASALGSRRTTQASNFSRFSRSTASSDMSTASTPNCRKQSARIVRAGSAISTRAARAAFFLGATAADRVASRVLSRKDMRVSPDNIVSGISTKGKDLDRRSGVQKCYYRRALMSQCWLLCPAPEEQRTIRSAEAERIRHRVVEANL